ncbi:MAG: hypothetical protein JW955_11770 [Sedimentisphaerales bacterium]|nr:hypothetical protein [Sedimentisphaerales bacterium]
MRRYITLPIVLAFSTSAWGYYISSVTVSPDSPTTATPVTVTVTGNAPATNYTLDHADVSRMANMLFLDMYWTSTGMGGTMLVPYTHQESLGTLTEGRYVVCVRSFYDGLIRKNKSVSFKVTKATDLPVWPGIFWYYWLWPGTTGFVSSIQMQSVIISIGQTSFDFTFSTAGGTTP